MDRERDLERERDLDRPQEGRRDAYDLPGDLDIDLGDRNGRRFPGERLVDAGGPISLLVQLLSEPSSFRQSRSRSRSLSLFFFPFFFLPD